MDRVCDIEVSLPGAPDLILDLLEANGAPIPAHALCRAGAVLGHQETTIRVALTRLSADRKIQREARGTYMLNQPGLPLAAALGTWSHEVSNEVPWQDDWIAVYDAETSRSDKALWRRHQLALTLRGFAPFRHGLHLRPCNRPGGVAAERHTLQALGLAPQACVFRLDQFDTEAQREACALWPVDTLNAGYRALLKALKTHQRALPRMPVEQALKESLLLGRTSIARLVRDPMLPSRLMRQETRNTLAVQVRDYQIAGRKLWSDWLSQE